MKEYEDQLGALKKENFNLKLRIYFLEERMGITSADEGAIKKNIELKVRSLSECAKLCSVVVVHHRSLNSRVRSFVFFLFFFAHILYTPV